MFRALTRLFRQRELPRQPFKDPVLGTFEFDRDLGWKRRIVLGNTEAELVLGSAGEFPSAEMLDMARSWIRVWSTRLPRIIEYFRSELDQWTGEPLRTDPGRFEVESINFLWKHRPTTCMIYFRDPDDDIRAWHVTFERLEPRGVGYDD